MGNTAAVATGRWQEELFIVSDKGLPPPDYESIERKQWKQSQREVIREAGNLTSRLRKRIATFISRFGYTAEDVAKKITDDEMFAAHFAKEPRRTGLHEKVAAEWIKALPYVHEFRVLPKAGNDSLKVSSDGNIVTVEKHANIPGKTLDFMWTTGGKIFYAMHKYTKEGGGNQDSQYQEMIELMKRFTHCRDNNVVLLVIVDGEYYQESGAKRLLALQDWQRERAPRSYALPVGELPEVLEQYENQSAEDQSPLKNSKEKILPQ